MSLSLSSFLKKIALVTLNISPLLFFISSSQTTGKNVSSPVLLHCLSPSHHRQDSEVLLQCKQHEQVLIGQKKKPFLPQTKNQMSPLWIKFTEHQGKTTELGEPRESVSLISISFLEPGPNSNTSTCLTFLQIKILSC